MARIKNVLEKAESMIGKINPRYDISVLQVAEIHQESGDWYRAITNAFRIGYMQGVKATKAEMKKGGVA